MCLHREEGPADSCESDAVLYSILASFNFCTLQFSVEWLNFPPNCGDACGHVLDSYTSKAIE